MTKFIIVGVDPGTTTAVATLDLKGEIIGLHSSKDMGISQTVKYILSIGRPSMVASDVKPAPDFVATVATRFGVTLHTPEKTLSVTEKINLTRPYNAADAHQRDALAAALNAYNNYSNKLRKAEASGLQDEAKHLILQGCSTSAAKAALEDKPETPTETPKKESEKPLTEDEKLIRDLRRRIRILQEVIAEKDHHIRELNEELAHIRRVKHMRPETKADTEKRINTLQARLTRQERIERILKRTISGETIPVGLYPQVIGGISLVEVKPCDTKWIKTAFTSKNKIREILEQNNIPTYDSKEVENDSGYHYITKKRLQELTRPQPEKTNIERIIQEYREERK